jgi:hypothetical protein
VNHDEASRLTGFTESYEIGKFFLDRIQIFQHNKYLLPVDKKINYSTEEITVINNKAFLLITRSFRYRKYRRNN